MKFVEPFGSHETGQENLDLAQPGAGLFARVEGQVKIGVADDRTRREPDAAASDHQSGALGAATLDQTIGIGQQHRLEDRGVVRSFARSGHLPIVPAGKPDQLIADPRDLASAGRIDAARPQMG